MTRVKKARPARELTVGTITPEQFARGEPWWGHKRRDRKQHLKKVVKPMNAKKIIEDGHSGFQRPENFDPVAEGAGWVMYAGMNDWETAITAMCVIFASDEESRRVWVKIKHTGPIDQDHSSEQEQAVEKVHKHGDKAWRTWRRTALEMHKNKNHGSRSWLEAFKAALKTSAMRPYVQDWGIDRTQWSGEQKEPQAPAAKVVEGLLA